MKGKITAIFDPKTGTVEYEVEGILGTKCTELTEALTQSQTVLKEEHTQEYYMNNDLPDYVDEF